MKSFQSPGTLFRLLVLACPFGLPLSNGAQNPVENANITLDLWNAKLAFNSDGHVLRVIGTVPDSSLIGHVRAFKYDAETGALRHAIDLGPGTWILSTTSDGAKAIIAAGVGQTKNHINLELVDTDTGNSEPLPTAWYDPNDDEPDVRLSGDGKLISLYTESGQLDHAMKVNVYRWPARTLLATQTSGLISAGGAFGGGVAEDGHAVLFVSSRVGPKLVDLKTGHQLAEFSRDFIRSPDGKWTVELPDITFEPENAPREVVIANGTSGKRLKQIDIPVPDDIAYGEMTGAFCGTSNRFLLASGHAVAAYALPSGTQIATFPVDTWRDPVANDPDRSTVACSPTGARVAIYSGTRLTLHTTVVPPPGQIPHNQ